MQRTVREAFQVDMPPMKARQPSFGSNVGSLDPFTADGSEGGHHAILSAIRGTAIQHIFYRYIQHDVSMTSCRVEVRCFIK